MKASETVQRKLTLTAGDSDHPVIVGTADDDGGELMVYALRLEDGRGCIGLRSSREAYALAQAATAIGDFLKERGQDAVVRDLG